MIKFLFKGRVILEYRWLRLKCDHGPQFGFGGSGISYVVPDGDEYWARRIWFYTRSGAGFISVYVRRV